MSEQPPPPKSLASSPANAGLQPPPLAKKSVPRWMLVLVGLLVLLGLVLAVTVLPIGIGSKILGATADSMAPTVAKDDYVYVNLHAYRDGTLPARGDLVILETGDAPSIQTYDGRSALYLKRVVGLPGETLAIVGGKLTVNGKVPPELEGLSYVTFDVPGGSLSYEGVTFTVPQGTVYVLGDNSKNSYDSRFWGAAPLKALRGRAEGRVWPLARVRQF